MAKTKKEHHSGRETNLRYRSVSANRRIFPLTSSYLSFKTQPSPSTSSSLANDILHHPKLSIVRTLFGIAANPAYYPSDRERVSRARCHPSCHECR